MQSRIQMTPSQIASQPSQARTQVIDTVGNNIATPSLFGDLASGIQAVMPQATNYADKLQKKFVDDAQKEGAEQQLQDPLAEPERKGQENPYKQDGRIEIWSKAKAADVSNRRQALTEEILQSNDPERINNAQKEFDEFDRAELQGIAQVDINVARQMFGPLMQQRNQSEAMVRNEQFKLKTQKSLQDYAAMAAVQAENPQNAQKAVTELLTSGATSGVPKPQQLAQLLDSAQVQLSRGNVAFAKALLDGVDPTSPSKDSMSIQFQRYGLSDGYTSLRNQVTTFENKQVENVKKHSEELSKARKTAMLSDLQKFYDFGNDSTAEWLADKYTTLEEAERQGLLTPEDGLEVRRALQEIPKKKAEKAETAHAAQVFANAMSAPGGPFVAIANEVNTGRIGKDAAKDFLAERNTLQWNDYLGETDPAVRGQKLISLIRDFAEQSAVSSIYKNPFVEQSFQWLSEGSIYGPDNKVLPGKEAHAEFLQRMLADKDAFRIINANIEDKSKRAIYQTLSKVVSTGVPPDKAMQEAQKLLSSPVSEAAAMRMTRDVTDQEWAVLRDMDGDGSGDRNSLAVDDESGVFWDSKVSANADNQMRRRFNEFRRSFLSTPGQSDSTDEQVLSAFKAEKDKSFISDTTGGFVVVTPEALDKFNKKLSKDKKPDVDRSYVTQVIQRSLPLLKDELAKKVGKANAEGMSFEVVQAADGDLEFVIQGPNSQGAQSIMLSQMVDIDQKQRLLKAKAGGGSLTPPDWVMGRLYKGTFGLIGYEAAKREDEKDAAAKKLVQLKPKPNVVESATTAASAARTFSVTPEQVKQAKPVDIPRVVQPAVQEAIQAGNYTEAVIMAHEGFTPFGPDNKGNVMGFGINLQFQSYKDLQRIGRDLNLGDSPEVVAELKRGVVRSSPNGRMTVEQAKVALRSVLPKYEETAINVLAKHANFKGDTEAAKLAFKQLAPHQRAALTLLAYNGPSQVKSQNKAYDLILAGRPQDIQTIEWKADGIKGNHNRPLQFAANMATHPSLFSVKQVGVTK